MTNFRIPEPDKVPVEFRKEVKICSRCWSEAELINGEWRHKGEPWLKEFSRQQFCDRYGYPIEVMQAIDEAKIRAALDGPCRRCGGGGWLIVNGSEIDCPVCHGSGHPEIPGVKRLKE